MKALSEIGVRKALRFLVFSVAHHMLQLLIFPPLRVLALRLLGARIGSSVVIHDVKFFNLYRTGFRGLEIADNCFMGTECLIDLADRVVLAEHVTLAERVTVLTHTNVGYRDHPLQEHFPRHNAPVIFRRGAFVGACSTILPGVEIGECAVVAAGALVNASVPAFSVVGGVPARLLRTIECTLSAAFDRKGAI